MRRLFLGLFCCTLGLLQAQPFRVSFEEFGNQEAFTQASWQKEGFAVPWVDGFDQDRAFVDAAFARSGEKSLRISYPHGGFGTAGTGAQAPLRIPPADQYFVSYWLRFSDDFSWGTTSFGGKLPGLGSGANCSGCTVCSGTNGFSARLMWRAGGKAVLYLYDMNKTQACGSDYTLRGSDGGDLYFERGKWHKIMERVKINTASNRDGEVELWLDGRQALLLNGLQFVNNGAKVDNLYFSTFHGGSTVAWAPANDSYIWFDDIVVSLQISDVMEPLSIFSPPSMPDLALFPQPVSPTTFLEIKGIINAAHVELIDAMGKEVVQIEIVDQGKIWMPSLKPGIYFVRVREGHSFVRKKLFIE